MMMRCSPNLKKSNDHLSFVRVNAPKGFFSVWRSARIFLSQRRNSRAAKVSFVLAGIEFHLIPPEPSLLKSVQEIFYRLPSRGGT